MYNLSVNNLIEIILYTQRYCSLIYYNIIHLLIIFVINNVRLQVTGN